MMPKKFPSKLVLQADSIVSFMAAVRALSKGATTDDEIGASFGATDRQGRYYRQAGVSMGVMTNYRNNAQLTPVGSELAGAPGAEQRRLLRAQFLDNKANRAFLADLSEVPAGWSRKDVADWIRKKTATGGSTIGRRASSLWGWSVQLGLAYEQNGLLKPSQGTIAQFATSSGDDPDASELSQATASEAKAVKKELNLPDYDPANEEEGRKRTLQALWLRRGQGTFRKALLGAYDRRCAITACDVANALNAAHINAYRGPQTNHPQNGLLLRADIHNLFDVGLISIDPDKMTVITSPNLIGTAYESLSGKKVTVPTDPTLRPHPDALKAHRKRFRL